VEIIIERAGAVGHATINRPDVLNALSKSVMKDLQGALHDFERDPSIRVIVLSGTTRAFAAGADISDLQGIPNAKTAQKKLSGYLSVWDHIGILRKPVIAAVSGYALGGGFELALACDFIMAAETAQFGLPELSLGLIPGAGGIQRLVKILGRTATMDILLTGRRLTARESLALGLVNRVVSDHELMPQAMEIAQVMARLPPLAVNAAKMAARIAEDTPLSKGLRMERKMFYRLFNTKDQKEGLRAFIEKRPARFDGR
jgi:enoyl-CoA hydratase